MTSTLERSLLDYSNIKCHNESSNGIHVSSHPRPGSSQSQETAVIEYDCPYCGGTGREPGLVYPSPCSICKGSGLLFRDPDLRPCRYCSGTGREPCLVYSLPCSVCAGRGFTRSPRPPRSSPTTSQRDSRLTSAVSDRFKWDVFVCHASHDKDIFVRPLAEKLSAYVKVWYDEFSLKVGDNLRRSIDKGLINSKYGVVVLSPTFFTKQVAQEELDGLSTLERDGRKVILPVWLDVDFNYVSSRSPTLANRVAANAADSMAKVVRDLLEAIQS